MEKIVAVGPYSDEMKGKLLKYLPDGMNLQYITSYEQYDALRDAQFIILRTLKLDSDQICTLGKAKLIQRWGAGYDTVDIAAAGQNGIPVAVCAGVNAQSVAELTVLLMLSVYRNLVPQVQAFAQGEDRRVEYSSEARCLNGKTVGIFGIGNIGRRVARIVRGFGASVLYYDVRKLDAQTETDIGCTYADADAVLHNADVVSLHLPAMESTKGFINKESIQKMKQGAILINAARQELVVEKDLAEAVAAEKLGGAGLDEISCPVKESAFAGMRNVICTPHIGGSTLDINDSMAQMCMEHIEAAAQGSDVPYTVNKNYLVV